MAGFQLRGRMGCRARPQINITPGGRRRQRSLSGRGLRRIVQAAASPAADARIHPMAIHKELVLSARQRGGPAAVAELADRGRKLLYTAVIRAQGTDPGRDRGGGAKRGPAVSGAGFWPGRARLTRTQPSIGLRERDRGSGKRQNRNGVKCHNPDRRGAHILRPGEHRPITGEKGWGKWPGPGKP